MSKPATRTPKSAPKPDAPRAEEPSSNRPKANRPKANRPKSDKPNSGQNRANRCQANTSETTSPEPGRPETLKPSRPGDAGAAGQGGRPASPNPVSPSQEPAPPEDTPPEDTLPEDTPPEDTLPEDTPPEDTPQTLDDAFGLSLLDVILPAPLDLKEGDLESASPDSGNGGSGRRGGWRGIRQADGLVDPPRLLAELALEAAMPARLGRRLRAGHALVVIVIVPSAGWVAPIEAAVRTASLGHARIVTRATRPRATIEAERDAEAADRIADPGALVAITPDAGFLAPVLVCAADHTLTVSALDARLVGRAVGLWCGRRPRTTLQAQDLAGLDLLDVAAALRTGATPSACLARIRRASRARIGVPVTTGAPPLDQLTGYGEALDWSRRAVADIARVRAGTLSADALESIVWFGPPGTGKTTLARATAAAAGVTCVETSVAAWFVEGTGYLDSVLKLITAFTERLELAAKRDGTAIGYIDELDALPSRNRLDDRNASYWQSVIVHVLTCTEKLRQAGVVLIAATNFVDRLDPALLRPGRFDRQMLIGPPDEAGRVGVLRHHLGEDLSGADLVPAARLSSGRTAADLAGHVRGARARARAAGRELRLDDVLAEIAPVETRSEADLRAVARHEAGHALAALRLGLRVDEVSILSGLDYGGRTIIQTGQTLPDRARLERRVIALLAGRAADAVLGDGVTAGAAGDLREATRQVAALHASLGLGDTLRAVVDAEHATALLREDAGLAERVEADLRRLQGVAEAMVRADRGAILALVDALLARRVLTGDEVSEIVGRHRPRIRVRSGSGRLAPSIITASRSTATPT